jgi:hypothetical protein
MGKEAKYEKQRVKELEALGCIVLKAEMLAPGFPDRMILWPGGRVTFEEYKVRPNDTTPLQERWIARLNAQGLVAEVVYFE